MVSSKNKNCETPLHEARRSGKAELVILLMETDPWVSCKLNSEKLSALLIACYHGHLEIVKKKMLNQPWLLESEEENVDQSSLDVAVSKGQVGTHVIKSHIELLEEIGQRRPCSWWHNHGDFFVFRNGFINFCETYITFFWTNFEGLLFLALCLYEKTFGDSEDASKAGLGRCHLPCNLITLFTPRCILLPWKEILQSSKILVASARPSFLVLTKCDLGTVFHLVLRFNHCHAFTYLAELFGNNHLLHESNRNGNTILHVAISKRHCQVRRSQSSFSLPLVAFLCLYNDASVALQKIYILLATCVSDKLLIFFSSLVLGCIWCNFSKR